MGFKKVDVKTLEIKPENFYETEEDERWYPEKDYHTMYIAEIRECWVRE